MKKYSGFTLVELMVVVAIIGIIGAIAYPSYDSYMKKAKRADAKVGLSKLADKQERYYLQNNTYATTIAALKTSATSDEGYYTFSIPSASVTAFMLQATQNSGSDTGCVTMTLSSTGAKEPNGDPATEKECW